MEKKRRILEMREKLDKTLGSADLVDGESIKSLVMDQLQRSSFHGSERDLDNVLSRRTKDVSNFLEMLRSASGNEKEALKPHGASHNDWKIKQDTDQLRVLYREGPHGTPFHTLLAEGCADGPIDVCLCVSWESSLYKKWWPQYNIPTFKITTSTCLQKVRIGEDIALVRMKVPWPISDREALLHYFAVEYFKEDLVITLINTVSDMEQVDVSTHGFSRDAIPEAKDTVRVDLVGGFVLQKVSADRSYFRLIANMDIKLDFMPPSLINFVSRQLIGNGHKLYQKALAVAMSDEDYCEALKDPMYVRIREGLDSHNKHKKASVSLDAAVGLDVEKHTRLLPKLHKVETALDHRTEMHSPFITEIVEEESEHSPQLGVNQTLNGTTSAIIDQQNIIRKESYVSPEVEHALGIIDRAIAIVRGGGLIDIQSDNVSVNLEFTTPVTAKGTNSINDDKDAPKFRNLENLPKDAEGHSPSKDTRCSDAGSTSVEAQQDSTLTKARPSFSGKTHEGNLKSSSRGKLLGAAVMPASPPIMDSIKVCGEDSLKVNGFHGTHPFSGSNKRKKKQIFCCFSLRSNRGRECQ